MTHTHFPILFALALCSPAVAKDPPPNIVFFLADDISQEDFGCYGHPGIKSPNIDALAGKGMRFDNAYLTTSSCSPSRCSIITGRYTHSTGAPELHVVLPDEQIRFPELLRKAGYHTVLSGKNHMFGDADRAFDEITRGGKPIGSLDWVRHVRERPKDKPFFFWFASDDAHRSWQVTEHAPTYEPDEIIIPPYMVDASAIPANPTPHRHTPPRIEDGKIILHGKQTGAQNPHAEMPGAARNATSINHPGPLRFTAKP